MRHLLSCVVVASLWAAPAEAEPIVYTDRTAFEAAVGQTTTETFDAPRESVFVSPNLFVTGYADVVMVTDHSGSSDIGQGEVFFDRDRPDVERHRRRSAIHAVVEADRASGRKVCELIHPIYQVIDLGYDGDLQTVQGRA